MHCLIVEDHPVTLLGMECLIKKQFPACKLTFATTCRAAMEVIREQCGQHFDLVLVDLLLPDGDGLSVIQHLQERQTMKSTKCIAIATGNDEEIAARCRDAGAVAFVSKASSLSDILRVIAHTLIPIQNNASSPARENGMRPDESIRLTGRQKDIVQLVMEGYSNKRIANALNLSYGTVKNYMFDLMRILGVKSRLELAIKCQENAHALQLETMCVPAGGFREHKKKHEDVFRFVSRCIAAGDQSNLSDFIYLGH
jgi:two-component system nitrate/nitrite response regulator NarL